MWCSLTFMIIYSLIFQDAWCLIILFLHSLKYLIKLALSKIGIIFICFNLYVFYLSGSFHFLSKNQSELPSIIWSTYAIFVQFYALVSVFIAYLAFARPIYDYFGCPYPVCIHYFWLLPALVVLCKLSLLSFYFALT